jgi:hypothetical protein
MIEGYFKDDFVTGIGRMKILKEDSVYEGEFLNGNREGWGILLWPDGSTMEG